MRRDSTFYGLHTIRPSEKKIGRMRMDTLENHKSGNFNLLGMSTVAMKQKMVGKHRKSIVGITENNQSLIELNNSII